MIPSIRGRATGFKPAMDAIMRNPGCFLYAVGATRRLERNLKSVGWPRGFFVAGFKLSSEQYAAFVR